MAERQYEGDRSTGSTTYVPAADKSTGAAAQADSQAAAKKKIQAAAAAKPAAGMPKSGDYPDLQAYGEAMRKWRESQKSAGTQAGALEKP
jgi:hypothetical protein